jgi:competence ComEA-like helix-hairpin-helix protein
MVLPRPSVSRCFLSFLLASLILSLIAAAKKKPPDHPINLNTATSAELQQVPGIGPVTADRVLKMRKVHGPFKSVNELRAIKGIGPRRLAKMKPYLTVGDAPDRKSAPRGKPAAVQKRP